jgi:hypothetical protein
VTHRRLLAPHADLVHVVLADEIVVRKGGVCAHDADARANADHCTVAALDKLVATDLAEGGIVGQQHPVAPDLLELAVLDFDTGAVDNLDRRTAMDRPIA